MSSAPVAVGSHQPENFHLVITTLPNNLMFMYQVRSDTWVHVVAEDPSFAKMFPLLFVTHLLSYSDQSFILVLIVICLLDIHSSSF